MNASIYAPLIRDMTWSYSRIKTYESCPHKFYLRYILGRTPTRAFFAEYGSFVHSLLERYYKGEIRRKDLPSEYLASFYDEVTSKAMSGKVFQSYFSDGLRYLREFTPIEGGIVKAEGKIDGDIDGIPFTGMNVGFRRPSIIKGHAVRVGMAAPLFWNRHAAHFGMVTPFGRNLHMQYRRCRNFGGLVQPDRRWWSTATGEMVHGDRTDGAQPPHLMENVMGRKILQDALLEAEEIYLDSEESEIE